MKFGVQYFLSKKYRYKPLGSGTTTIVVPLPIIGVHPTSLTNFTKPLKQLTGALYHPKSTPR